ncbi:MAG: hypothetical protein AAFX06_04990 [Planctomycetota bacterium]
MSRFGMNRWMWMGCIALGTVVAVPSAQAASPLCQASDQYREAIRRFEREVLRCDVARVHERLVDDLEDSTSRLRSAARNPERLDRLYRAFYETRFYHQQVERVFFIEGVYPPNPRLDFYWDIATRAYIVLEQEMQRCGSPHGFRPNYPVANPVAPVQTCRPSSRLGYSTRINVQVPSVAAPSPALSPFSIGPALDPRSVRPQLPLPPAPSVTPIGLEDRFPRTSTPTRQSVRDGYRMVLTGAMLQRLINDR